MNSASAFSDQLEAASWLPRLAATTGLVLLHGLAWRNSGGLAGAGGC